MPQKMKFRVEFVVADRENRGLPRNHSQKPSTRKIFTLQHDILTLNFPSHFIKHPSRKGQVFCFAGTTGPTRCADAVPRVLVTACSLKANWLRLGHAH